MKPLAMFPHRLLLAVLVPFLTQCDTVKSVASRIPLPPLPSLPDFTQVKNMIPGTGSDKVDGQDPDIDFDPRGTLRPGHTLRLQVHESLRSAKQVWKGLVVVQLDGTVSLGKIGSAQVRGNTVPQAARAIESVFRVAGRTSMPLAVHIVSVENVPLIAVEGDLAAGPQPLPVFDGLTYREAVRLAGGRPARSTNRGVYVTREGRKRFFPSVEAADAEWKPVPGDILTLSTDL